jgi:predicted ArsR family transcriptional regulator
MATEKMNESESVKRLLILLLLKLGATSEEIGVALDITSSGVRKMFSIKSIKKLESVR